MHGRHAFLLFFYLLCPLVVLPRKQHGLFFFLLIFLTAALHDLTMIGYMCVDDPKLTYKRLPDELQRGLIEFFSFLFLLLLLPRLSTEKMKS